MRLPLRSERLVLRLPTQDDVEPWFRILTSPKVAELMVPARDWTRDAVKKKVYNARAAARDGSMVELAVVLRGSGKVIGRVALKRVELREHRRAEIAYWFDNGFWGQGLAREAVHLLCSAGFRDLHLHRIDACAFEFNKRSLRLIEGLGFRREGTLRESLFIHGNWFAEVRFGVLEGELRLPVAKVT